MGLSDRIKIAFAELWWSYNRAIRNSGVYRQLGTVGDKLYSIEGRFLSGEITSSLLDDLHQLQKEVSDCVVTSPANRVG